MRNALLATALLAAACGSSSTPPAEPVPAEPVAQAEPTEPATPVEPAAPVAPAEPVKPPEPTSRHVGLDQVTWMPLDPSAGDKGPMLAIIYGDPATGPVGFFIKAPPKFASPPHVHTSDYTAVVITGTMTNDLPKARKPVKMGPGSMWSQPGGAVHVTACLDGCLAYGDVFGKFDSLPADKTGPSPGGMKPLNLLAKDLKWVAPPGTQGIWFAQAWGDPNSGAENGFFVKLEAGFPGMMHTHTNDYHAVVIQGSPRHWEPGETPEASPPGSYFWQKGGAPHQDSCDPGADCISYVHMMGKLDMFPAKTE